MLNTLLAEHVGQSLNVTTAYFDVGEYRLLGHQLAQLRSFRLLLSFRPSEGRNHGLRPGADWLKVALRSVRARSTIRKVQASIEQAQQRMINPTG